mmetsp:Transcript_93377/g.209003  ORF Transcript_93377/g.209003 Transcript_93377/m.209003 type:complete len:170 (-) Transcript_93377:121-630(-)
MAIPSWARFATVSFAIASLLPSTSVAATPIAQPGRHLSALQTAYTMGKAGPGEQLPRQETCRSPEEEAALRKSLQLRLRHLEHAATGQRKRLNVLSTELTGETAAGLSTATKGADLMARVESLELGLTDRSAVIEELLKSTRAAAERTASKLEGAEAGCAVPCTCDDTA